MANAPAFQFYARDFLASTADMTAAEVGVYIRALCVQWDRGSVPADDDVRLARQFGVSVEDFSAIWPLVVVKFRRTKAGYINARLEVERKKQAEYRHKQAEKGKASGRARTRTTVEPRLNHGSSPVGTEREPALVEPEGNSAICDLRSASAKKIKSIPRTKRAEPAEGFEEFWALYPLKVSKASALKAWNRICPDENLRRGIAAALGWQSLTFVKDGQVKGVYAATWLNGERWNDERPLVVRERGLPAPEPAYDSDWWAECQALHGGQCDGQYKHGNRMQIDAAKAAQVPA